MRGDKGGKKDEKRKKKNAQPNEAKPRSRERSLPPPALTLPSRAPLGMTTRSRLLSLEPRPWSTGSDGGPPPSALPLSSSRPPRSRLRRGSAREGRPA